MSTAKNGNLLRKFFLDHLEYALVPGVFGIALAVSMYTLPNTASSHRGNTNMRGFSKVESKKKTDNPYLCSENESANCSGSRKKSLEYELSQDISE